MLRGERDDDVCVLGANGSRVAVGKIDTAIRQADVVDDAGEFLRRYHLPDFAFHSITQSSCFLNASARWRAEVHGELSTVHGWKKVLSQPWDQTEGEKTGHEEASNKYAAMTDKRFQ